MRLFILSLLAISHGVNSHAIGGTGGAYTYRTGLLGYSPARGEFPVQDGLAQGYVRYVDVSGTQRLIGYNYPEPLYGVRRLSVSNEEIPNPLLRTSLPTGVIGAGEQQQQYLLQDSGREAQFRAWCEQRYQVLKSELDKLRTEGKVPSTELIAQMEPLEKLLKGSNYEAVTIAGETPEVKQAREEHLRIWNEARLRVLQLEGEQMRLQNREPEDKPIAGATFKTGIETSATAISGETAEQKRAREEHLRIYNEQLMRIRELEAANKPAVDFANRIDTEVRPISESAGLKTEIKLSPSGVVLETPEVMRAREEHLRLYNEAKLRAEKEGYKYENEQETAAGKLSLELPVQTTLISATKIAEAVPYQESIQQLNVGLKSVAGFDAPTPTQIQPQQPAQIQDTPEVMRAREEHLRLKAQIEGGAIAQPTPIVAVRTSIEETQSQPQQPLPIQETPEVIRAREEHFKLLNEAKLRAQAEGSYNPSDDGSYKPDNAEQIAVLRMVPAIQQPIQSVPAQVTETPEVLRAREEHLRLVSEAKLQATKQQQQITPEIPAGIFVRSDSDTTTIYSGDNTERLRETERMREEERLLETERLREAERLSGEEKMREAERLRELERLKEEERKMVEERLRLQKEEEQRIEFERLAEAKRLAEEQQLSGSQLQISSSGIIGQIKTETQPLPLPYAQQANIISLQRKENPFFLRFGAEKPSYLVDHIPLRQSPSTMYLPAVKTQNPFFIRYTQEARPETIIPTPVLSKTDDSKINIGSEQIGNIDSNFGKLSASMKINYGEGAGLSELERATREHFRAHEIALEQLRLANLNSPKYKDC